MTCKHEAKTGEACDYGCAGADDIAERVEQSAVTQAFWPLRLEAMAALDELDP